ncbi:hypothetical protein ACCS78_34745, partial [Rhizobium johnstonii]
LLDIQDLPRSMVVIGAGVIGIEYATQNVARPSLAGQCYRLFYGHLIGPDGCFFGQVSPARNSFTPWVVAGEERHGRLACSVARRLFMHG